MFHPLQTILLLLRKKLRWDAGKHHCKAQCRNRGGLGRSSRQSRLVDLAQDIPARERQTPNRCVLFTKQKSRSGGRLSRRPTSRGNESFAMHQFTVTNRRLNASYSCEIEGCAHLTVKAAGEA